MRTLSTLIIIAFCFSAAALRADDAKDSSLHKPDPKRMADFEACQKEAGIPRLTPEQMKKKRDCMMKKKPASPPPTGDKMAFIRAQMEASRECGEQAGIKPPTHEQMLAVHKCMSGKGYKGYSQP